jgi:magnesium and cobalt transporter
MDVSVAHRLPDDPDDRELDRVEEESRPSLVKSVKDRVCQMFGLRQGETATLKEVIEEVIEEHAEDQQVELPPEEKAMLHNVLSFGETTVHDIIIPRADIVAVPEAISLNNLKSHILKQRHTRIPVYRETLDNVLGFLHIKDLLPMIGGDATYDLQMVLRPVLFVPPSMKLMQLLVKMRGAGSHMAIVVDEFGGTDGLVTMEDLVEEIVGEIQDEHDDDDVQHQLSKVGNGVYEADGRVRIRKLERTLGVSLVTEERREDFDTLGGLIFSQLGRVPAKGEVLTNVTGVKMEILDADARRIRRVRLTLRP